MVVCIKSSLIMKMMWCAPVECVRIHFLHYFLIHGYRIDLSAFLAQSRSYAGVSVALEYAANLMANNKITHFKQSTINTPF